MELPTVRKPEGGFRFISVVQLCLIWWAYRERLIRLGDLRVWFAAHELVARRCSCKDGQQPRYTVAELQRLVGGRGGGIRTALERLESVGLLTWASSVIVFANSPDEIRGSADLAGFHAMLGQIRNTRRQVPVPRRTLRFIAGGCRRAVIATMLGHLLRCLYYRNGQCIASGLCKASWIAQVFGVHLRTIKAARKQLAEIGWLTMLDTPQWARNRWGIRVEINLAWAHTPADPPATSATTSPPPAPLAPLKSPPPDSYMNPLQEQENQQPAAGRPTGDLHTKKDDAALPPPTIRRLLPPDLRETERLLALFENTVRQGLIGPSEAERLQFVAAAEHARRVGAENPCGLFAWIVRRGLWHVLTQEDEDAARHRLRRHLYGNPSRQAGAAPLAALSQDATFVRLLQERIARAGFDGDVVAAVRRTLPAWTRERWERAVAEVENARYRSIPEPPLTHWAAVRAWRRAPAC